MPDLAWKAVGGFISKVNTGHSFASAVDDVGNDVWRRLRGSRSSSSAPKDGKLERLMLSVPVRNCPEWDDWHRRTMRQFSKEYDQQYPDGSRAHRREMHRWFDGQLEIVTDAAWYEDN